MFELIIEPLELDYELEIAKARDGSDVIEPHVQEILLPKDIVLQIEKVVKEIEFSFYHKKLE